MDEIMRRCLFVFLASTLLVGGIVPAFAQAPSPGQTTQVAASSSLDPAAATQAWLDTVPADKREKSDAYFEGGYWLILWNYLASVAFSLLLLWGGISAWLRDFAERRTRFRPLQIWIYAVGYLLLATILTFPLTLYTDYFREHQYELATQNLPAWLGDQTKGLIIALILTPALLVLLYTVFRRAPRTWWLWGTGLGAIFLVVAMLVSPIFIEPLFNTYKPLSDPKISDPILVMAAANQIPVHQVFEVDASRQTNRVSANVAGMFGTTRIALNDNLLKQCTLPEIRAVMAHEMGHYVLNHGLKLVLYFGLFMFVGFAPLNAVFDRCIARWGERWGVRGIADPAGLPLLALILATYFFFLTPLQNSAVRVTEREADAFGLNTAREADGFAKVALKLGTYRKLNPGPWEEAIFFDHPSGRARIRMAMDWKAAHLPPGDAAGPLKVPSR